MGLKPGFVTHSVAEAHALAAAEPEVYTSYAQARVIQGDGNQLARLDGLLAGVRESEAERILAYLTRRDQDAAQHDLYGAEPDLKNGAGGLRDVHAGQWIFALHHENASLDALLQLDILPEDQHLAVVDGRDFLWRIRNEMHFHTGKPGDRLTFALQAHVAEAFGYGPGNQDAVRRFMQDYYAAARKLRAFYRLAARHGREARISPEEAVPEERRRVVAPRGGAIALDTEDRNWFSESPPRLMELFWHCARLGLPLGPGAERWVRDSLGLVNEAFQRNDLVRRYFVALCNRPLRAGFALRQAAHAGLLGAYLPEFGAIQDIICYEDFHSYPVDEHTLRALEALGQLDQMAGPVARVLQENLDHIRAPHVLVLAILCHDLGKAEGETHVEEGVQLVHGLGARIGLEADEIEQVAFLVRHHMLMSNIALYRNTDDPDVIAGFADTMQSVDRLRELLLLTYADLSAVGPNVWTEWKGALLLKLYLRAERHLLGRAVSLEEDYWTLPKAEEVARLLPDRLAAQVPDYLRSLGEQYFFGFSAQRMAQHIECLDEARRSGLSVRWLDVAHTELTEVVVCTRDHRRLFAKIAGSFTAQLADVNGASLFTTPDGSVVDVFLVTDVAHRRPLTENQLRGFETVLRDVLLNGHDIEEHIARSRSRLFALSRPRVPAPVRIAFDDEASRTDTVIDVEGPDRTGLLYDLGSALAAEGLDVHTARIVTDARRVRDAFYVRHGGEKLPAGPVREAILDRLAAALRGMMPAGSTGDPA
jgi:[protein-PII] uridylyltransferase